MLSSKLTLQAVLVKLQLPNVILGMLGFFVAFLAVLTDWKALTIALALLALGGGVALAFLPGSNGPQMLLGQFPLNRALVLVAAVVLAPEHNWWLNLGFLALGIVVLLEPPIARMFRVPPFAANLPGWEYSRPADSFSVALFWIDGALIALALLFEAFNISLLTVSVAALADLVFVGWLMLRLAGFQKRRSAFDKALPKIMKELQPAFALHWQAPAGTSYQAKMWLPYLERLNKPYFILVRTATNFADICKETDAPVILRGGMSELADIVCDSLKVMFYVNTATRNDHVLRYKELTHVQLNHGDSDKAPSYNPMFRVYDRNFVAGQAAIDRFAANGVWMPKEMFTIVGRPQVADVKQASAPIAELADPTLLYA
ncbi:MAG: hypothetical protein LBK28_04045, partial [Propionibacteriaceae bacterium]|nr:hypothetical protein [Propionibacteriaceae bacterium]